MKNKFISALALVCLCFNLFAPTVFAVGETTAFVGANPQSTMGEGTLPIGANPQSTMSEGVLPVGAKPQGALSEGTAPLADTSVSVSASLQNADVGGMIGRNETLTVKSGTALKYGYKNAPSVTQGQVTTLDVLVQLIMEAMGSCDESYLCVNDSGWVTEYLGSGSNFGFILNGIQANDGVFNEAFQSYTAYAVNAAVVKDGDKIEFFSYKDTSLYNDFYAWFEKDGVKAETFTTKVGEDLKLKVRGYSFAPYGAAKEDIRTKNTKDMPSTSYGLLDENSLYTEGGKTDKEGYATYNFSAPGRYVISLTGDIFYDIIIPYATVVVSPADVVDDVFVSPVFSLPNTLGTPEDFANDLLCQYDYKQLKINETAVIYPRRVPQIVSDNVQNDVQRPNFNFEIIVGDSISLSDVDSTQQSTATAVKNGITIVKITYDEMNYKGKVYGKSSVVNSAYIVFDVNDSPAPLSLSTSIKQTSYDTLYFSQGNTKLYSFTIDAKGATRTEVKCNGTVLSPSAEGGYVASLNNGGNIIGIDAFDKSGKRKSLYTVLDARKIQVKVENATSPKEPLRTNEKVKISFKGISNPVPKLAAIYNPTWYAPAWGSNGTYVHYFDSFTGQTLKGYCGQWDLDVKNTIEFTPLQSGDYTLSQGQIYSMWWGEAIGADKTIIGKNPNLNSGTNEGEFAFLPDITFTVEQALGDIVPVKGISLNASTGEISVGESLPLSANISPASATNKKVKWSVSNSFFATVSDNGVVRAINASTENVPQITVTATTEDGDFTAKCTLTIRKSDAADQVKADVVIGMIDALGSITLDSASAVNSAQRAYLSLSQKQKNLVSNYYKLSSAQERLAYLKAEKLLSQSGNSGKKAPIIPQNATRGTAALIKDIYRFSSQLPAEKDGVSTLNQNLTANLYSQYSALDEDQQALVTNFEDLKKATEFIALSNQTYADYGIAFENLPWNIKPVCTPCGNDVNSLSALKDLSEKIGDMSLLKMFSLNFYDIVSGEEYFPSSDVNLCLSTLETDEKSLAVVFLNEGAELSYLDVTPYPNTVSCPVRQRGYFALASYEGASPFQLNAPTSQGKMGDYLPAFALMIGGFALLTGVYIFKKFKRNKSEE